jgi:hypothetical protein
MRMLVTTLAGFDQWHTSASRTSVTARGCCSSVAARSQKLFDEVLALRYKRLSSDALQLRDCLTALRSHNLCTTRRHLDAFLPVTVYNWYNSCPSLVETVFIRVPSCYFVCLLLVIYVKVFPSLDEQQIQMPCAKIQTYLACYFISVFIQNLVHIWLCLGLF